MQDQLPPDTSLFLTIAPTQHHDPGSPPKKKPGRPSDNQKHIVKLSINKAKNEITQTYSQIISENKGEKKRLPNNTFEKLVENIEKERNLPPNYFSYTRSTVTKRI